MHPVTKRIRAAALELVRRLRVGLDIPSRSEVLDLANRLETIGQQISSIEAMRVDDAALVAQLREEFAAKEKPRATSTRSETAESSPSD
jgi:hypothetical protein